MGPLVCKTVQAAGRKHPSKQAILSEYVPASQDQTPFSGLAGNQAITIHGVVCTSQLRAAAPTPRRCAKQGII
jgi:hypothetical protein